MTDPRLTTAAAEAALHRQLADDWFDRSADVWLRLTAAAERYAAMKPDTIIPTF